MKIMIVGCCVLIALFMFCGCRYYSWMILQNPEFSDEQKLADLSSEILHQYTVGDVIVQPRIIYADGNQMSHKLFVVLFSKDNSSVVMINKATVSVNGIDLNYENKIVNESMTAWEPYSLDQSFYVSNISGKPMKPLNKPIKQEMGLQIDVSLVVLVDERDGTITEKQIDAQFIPTKRSYFE